MGDDADDAMSRRGFMQVGTTSLLALASSPGQVSQQIDIPDNPTNDDAYRGVADLIGPADAKPAAGSGFFDNKEYFAYRYETTDTYQRFFIQDGDSRWTELNMNPQTQVEEVRTEDFTSFFNHTFARPQSPDDKNWVYTDADVTKAGSEVELAATTSLHTTQRGNYPPGTEAVPGVAFRVTGTPTGGRGEAGYFDGNDGFGVGEDSTNSYVFIRNDGTTERVYRSDWNGYDPGERVWARDSPVITRFPHLFYGGGSIRVRVLLHDGNEPKLRTLHTFTPENVPGGFGAGPPFTQPNLPVRFETSSLAGGSLRANAAHYEFGESDAENRVNGVHYGPTTVGTTGWTLLAAWRKRTGWEMVNVKPLKISATAETNPVRLELQLNPSLSTVTTGLPPHTGSDETSVEEITSATVDSFGERRWVGYAPSGQGSATDSISAQDLTFNLPVDRPVALFGQAVGGDAIVNGAVAWEEYF